MEIKYEVKKEKFEVVKENGQTIRGLIFRPDDDEKRFPCVIFAHGFGGCYSDLMHHGDGFAEDGIICVFFDFCGGGVNSTSDGTMKEMTLATEADDLDHVLDAVIALPYVKDDAITLQGESQGGVVSAIVAPRRLMDINGMVLWYPAFVIPDDSRRRMKEGIKDVFGMEISPDYNDVAVTIDVTDLQKNFYKPVLLIHGDQDPVVPIDYSKEASRTYSDAVLKTIKGAGHGFDGDDSVNARQMSINFIKGL